MRADKQGVAGTAPPPEQVDLAVEVFRMLADATRVRLLWALLDDELAVNELAAAVGKPAPGVSQHLAKLRMARLVQTRRQGTQIFYRLESAHVRQLVLDAVRHAEHAGPGVPDHHRGKASSTSRLAATEGGGGR
jgi:ArsR family transcriptional regulator, zinc-responsive transcriptional repressor